MPAAQATWREPPMLPWDPKTEHPKAPQIYKLDWPDWYPPIDDVRANLIWRTKVWAACRSDPKIAKRYNDQCAKDINFWLAGFAFIFEARASGGDTSKTTGTKIPLQPFAFQFDLAAEIIRCIDDQVDLVLPKSRDMGATWISLLTITWMWLYRDGFTALLLSKKEDDVDKRGDPRALFEKMRFNLRCLPAFMMPRDFSWKNDSRHMILMNPETKSTISGEATTPDSGRSGRYNAILKDEHAALDKNIADGLETATADASPCRIYLSTPKGNQNAFARKAHSGCARMDMHWMLHPFKGYAAWQEIEWKGGKLKRGKVRSPWYDYEVQVKRKSDPEWMISQELDISFEGSGATIFDSGVVKMWRDDQHEPISVDFKQHRDDGDFALWTFEDPLPDTEYLVSCDPARGVAGGSFAVIHVFKLPDFDQVAEYQGRPSIDLLSTIMYLLGSRYNYAFACIEENIGKQINLDLMKGHVDHEGLVVGAGDICPSYPRDRIADHLLPDGKEPANPKLGINTNATTRPYMIYTLGEPAVRQQECRIRSKRTLDQMSGFSQHGAKVWNPEGDDGVMSFLVGLYGYRVCWKPGSTFMMPILTR